jgi:hypothetical protein
MQIQDVFFNPENKYCIEECNIYNDCGGGKFAPCGCIQTENSKKYDCDNCSYICTERKGQKDVHMLLSEGLDLLNLKVKNYFNTELLPLFIPLGTRNADSVQSLSWIGVEFSELITKGKLPKLNKYIDGNSSNIYKHLNVTNNTGLIAVLNANDEFLENFWGMPYRQNFYSALKNSGFSIVTGPTFSVIREETGYPAPQNIVMQNRHHKIISEIQDSGLIPAPNIYWRNELDMKNWIDWLNKNQISIISRDFSMTKKGNEFNLQLEEFISIVKALNYHLHILLVGVGLKNGVVALRKLLKLNVTVSIVSHDPAITAARVGKEYKISHAGKLEKFLNKNFSRKSLVAENIKTAVTYLKMI